MKFLSCLIFALFSAFTVWAQKKPRDIRQEIIWMRNVLQKYHVELRVINDDFSADLFQKMLHDLDPERIIFTAQEIAGLEHFRTRLDDEIQAGSTGFLQKLKTDYKRGLQRSEKLINAVCATPLDWNKNETFVPDAMWLPDEVALADRHRQWLKYEVLGRVLELAQRDTVGSAEFLERHLQGAIDHVRQEALRPLRRLLSDPVALDNNLSDLFLDSFAGVFDAHSDYFSTKEYEDFVTAISNEDYYFGFMLEQDVKGNVVISALAPGGPAWRSGVLHVSDALVALKSKDGREIDLRGMNVEEVNNVLSQDVDDALTLTVRGIDGEERTVSLRKEKIQTEENVVQSFILDGTVRAGYIYLPDFYTQWDDDQQGGRCASDVAKEIIRLKKDGIEALILDLRFNGGGSLYEAAAMAGIFIDEGPLSMVSTRERKALSLKDMNRGTVYDGPLVLLVNGASASASEVLAGTIQDYNRGIIVGSPTYGKATGQGVFRIDGIEMQASNKSASGYVKVTTQRLYRLTGKSVQCRGVTADVLIPDIFQAWDISERQHLFALKPDSVNSNAYFKPMPPVNKLELQRRSAERIAADATFQELLASISLLKAEIKKHSEPQPLNWQSFSQAMDDQQTRQSRAEGFKSAHALYKVRHGSAKAQQLSVDDYARELHARWVHNLSTDIHLQETYQILNDYISLTKNP